MSFKEVKAGDVSFLKPKDMTKGQVVEGKLKSKKHNPTLDSWTYYIETKDGTTGLNGCGQLDYNMADIEKGTTLRLTYLGKQSYKGAIQPAHQFKVEIDDDAVDEPAPDDTETIPF